MTNRPPSNVKLGENEPCRVLASGIDSLTLAIQVEWQSDRAFRLLDGLKQLAKSSNESVPARLDISSESSHWLFDVKPHGKQGYEWMIAGSEFALKIGNWRRPQQRPSIMAEIRSETLWMHSPQAATIRLLELVKTLGGVPVAVKPSRVDPCMDILLHRSDWTRDLEDCFVTKARYIDPHTSYRKLTGFSIGRGQVSARLYDKPQEIASKSGKIWMYDIWDIDEVPDDCVIVRVEFQFRRERLKELGCDTWEDLQERLPRLWAYATNKWLRIVDDASLHHTQQTVLPWWGVVTNGFSGAQDAEPLVRKKANAFELRRQAEQVIGGLNSIVALFAKDEVLDLESPLDVEFYTQWALERALKVRGMSDRLFTKRVIRKQPRYFRSRPGFRKSK